MTQLALDGPPAGSREQPRVECVIGSRAPRSAVRGRGIVVCALVLAAILLLVLTALSPTAEWRLGTFAAVNALVCAAGVRMGRTSSTHQFTALDVFLGVAFLSGSVVTAVELVGGAPQVSGRKVGDLVAATHAQMALTAFVAAVVMGWGLVRADCRQADLAVAPVPPRWPSLFAASAVVALGLAGLALRLETGLRPGSLAAQASQAHAQGLIGLLGTLLAPFTAVGCFLLVMDPTGRISRGPRILVALVLVPVSVYALATFSLNRAIFIVPAATMLLVTLRTRRVERVAVKVTASALLAVVFFTFIGQLRLSEQRDVYGSSVVPTSTSWQLIQQSAEVYLQAPYVSGAAYSTRHAVDYDVLSLLSSALAPIPALGSRFRDQTGTALYNRAIGRGAARDQLPPTWAEIELSIGTGPMVLLGVLGGIVLRIIDRRARAATSTTGAYGWTFLMLWTAQLPIVSVLVLAQITFFYVLPLFVSLVLPGLRGRAVPHRPPTDLLRLTDTPGRPRQRRRPQRHNGSR